MPSTLLHLLINSNIIKMVLKIERLSQRFVSASQTHKITNHELQKVKLPILHALLCQPSSMNKDCSNLSKSCFDLALISEI